MAGTTIVLGLKAGMYYTNVKIQVKNIYQQFAYFLIKTISGDEVCVYAYTGTWLADFPMNHYTHWVGLLLKPSQEEEENFMKEAESSVDAGEMTF